MNNNIEQSTKWCFTLHFDNVDDADFKLINIKSCRDFEDSYGVGQVELCPTTAKPHIQGFVVFNKNVTGKRLIESFKEFMNKHACHIDKMKGTIEQSEAYCSKAETRAPGCDPFTWGTKKTNRQGKRTDLEEATASIREMGQSLPAGKKMRLLARNAAHSSTFVKYHRGLQEFAAALEEPEPTPEPESWRPWQISLRAELEKTPDNRTIYWIYDPVGNSGKSHLVAHYITRELAVVLDGRLIDMFYTYQKERIVFFDIPRAGSEHCDHLYRCGEKLKDGFFLSTKYTPVAKTFRPPHVVYMSNSPYPTGAWSEDRVVHYHLHADGTFEVGQPTGFAASTTQATALHQVANESAISPHTNPFADVDIPNIDDLSQIE